jgi:Cu-processing system ATP-binding protein
MAAASTLLSLENVTRTFAGKAAVSALSLEVAQGDCLALVGHNGAGKTTLLKMILGLLRPTSGRISIAGEAPGARRLAVGFLPENVVFNPVMSGRELLSFYGRLKGEPNLDPLELLTRAGLEDASDKRLGAYSKGMRQRLGLAQALIGRPELLILDEPTSGLDPSSRRAFYRVLGELRDKGTTILLSSHALSEIGEHTSTVAILRHGRLLAHGPQGQLAQEAALPTRIDILVAEGQAGALANGLGDVALQPLAEPGWVRLQCAMSEKTGWLRRLLEMDGMILDLRVQPPTLDDLYEHFQNGEGGK